MKKIMILSLTAILAIADMDTYFDNAIHTMTTQGGYYETQTRGVYTLGGARVRVSGHGSINPVHLEPPRISMGCGGIDAVWGGFSYLKPDYIVEKLKAIASGAAPAFAYRLAMSTLSKEVDMIVGELEKAAQWMNSFNIDSCRASQRIGTDTADLLMGAINGTQTSGQSNDFIGSMDKAERDPKQVLSDWANRAGYYVGNNELGQKAVDTITLNGSLIEQALILSGADLSVLGADSKGGSLFVSLTRAMAGDVIGYKRGGEGDGKDAPDIADISPLGLTPDQLLTGGNIPFIYIKTKPTGYPDYATGAINFVGLREKHRSMLHSILEQMKFNRSLTAEQMAYISSLPIPAYRYLNVDLMVNSDNLDLLADMVAVAQIRSFTRSLIDLSNRALSVKSIEAGNMTPDAAMEKIRRVREQVEKADKTVSDWFAAQDRELDKRSKANEYYKKVEREMKAQLTKSGLLSNYLFGASL
jgi:conjugative transfer pilus assembly protein TraH